MSALAFDLPDDREAHAPAEARGLARDEVRMLVAGPNCSSTAWSATCPTSCTPATCSW